MSAINNSNSTNVRPLPVKTHSVNPLSTPLSTPSIKGSTKSSIPNQAALVNKVLGESFTGETRTVNPITGLYEMYQSSTGQALKNTGSAVAGAYSLSTDLHKIEDLKIKLEKAGKKSPLLKRKLRKQIKAAKLDVNANFISAVGNVAKVAFPGAAHAIDGAHLLVYHSLGLVKQNTVPERMSTTKKLYTYAVDFLGVAASTLNLASVVGVKDSNDPSVQYVNMAYTIAYFSKMFFEKAGII